MNTVYDIIDGPLRPCFKWLHKVYLHEQDSREDPEAKELATLLYETATLRSGYELKDSASFAERIERVLRRSYSVSLEEKVSTLYFLCGTHSAFFNFICRFSFMFFMISHFASIFRSRKSQSQLQKNQERKLMK